MKEQNHSAATYSRVVDQLGRDRFTEKKGVISQRIRAEDLLPDSWSYNGGAKKICGRSERKVGRSESGKGYP